MAPKADQNLRIQHLHILSPLLTSPSKAILTCRPAYFLSVSEYNRAIAGLNVELAPLPIGTLRASPRPRRESKRRYYQAAVQSDRAAQLSQDGAYAARRATGPDAQTDIHRTDV